MAKKKIKNMTRAEHKRALERAVGLQAAAMREARGQLFLPKLDRRDGKSRGDLYTQVVKSGKELLQRSHVTPGSRLERIVSYYSRKDVQSAMYEYAKGRKISVLRNFRPMFNGSQLREPGDLLPIMVFYSQEARLWPSIHGTVSRHNGDGRQVCDLVVEVDFKKSRARSFNLARPIIKLFQDIGVEFRMKFSGNSSPHIIIPAEAFPLKWRRAGRCSNLYGKLLDFLRRQIKMPNTLDRSFRSPSHFLRMPYSLNENTGLVSLPIRVEDFDRFSWEMARPDTAKVVDDWWSPVPVDAPERTEVLIEMAFGRRKVFAVRQEPGGHVQESLKPQMPITLSVPVRMGMVRVGEEIAARGSALMREPSMQDILRELREAAAEDTRDTAQRLQLVNALAQRHGVGRENVQLLWQWWDRADALAYYSRPDVQEAIYSHVQGRCLRMEGIDEYLTLDGTQDIFALVAYMVGGGVVPTFRCTNARYDPENGEMVACDVVLQVDQELSNSVALLLRAADAPSFALYSGDAPLRIVLPFEALKASSVTIPRLAESVRRHLQRMLRVPTGIRVSLYEGTAPVPYSLADDGKQVNMPVKLDEVPRLSPGMARTASVNVIRGIESLMPPDSAEKAARFFKEVIL